MANPEFKMQQNNWFAVILFFFILLFLYTKFAGPLPLTITSTQTTKDSSFQVTGEGKESALPNQATISFGVTKQATTVADATDQTNKAVDAILNSLKGEGVDTNDIKTTSYNVNPQYDFRSAGQSITGYQVSQNIDVKIKQLETVNKVLDTLTASGANVVNQVSFGFDDKAMKDLQNKARTEAVAQAKEKAQDLANIAGFHLGKIIDVQENFTGGTPFPMMYAAKNAGGALDSQAVQPSNVTPGENEVDVSITLSYETY